MEAIKTKSKELTPFDIFKKEQFRDMMFDVFFTDSKKNLFNSFPEILSWTSVKKYKDRRITMEKEDKNGKIVKRKIKAPTLDLEPILRYIFFVYDMKSPLVKQTKILQRRKEWGVVLSGLYGAATKKRIEEVTTNDDAYVVAMIVEFLTRYQPVKWTMICSYEQQFDEFQNTLMRRITQVRDDKDLINAVNTKSALLEKSDKIAERIAALYKEVFTDEFASTARAFSKTTPEQRALMNLERLKKIKSV